MWLLIAEALIVLAMGIFIVWWTMKSRRRDDGGDVGSTAATPPVAAKEGADSLAKERARQTSGN